MKRTWKITALLAAIALLFTLGRLSTAGAREGFMASLKAPSDLAERLENAVVLFVGSPDAFVKNEHRQVDPENPSIKPIIRDSRTLVPVRFIAESFGARVTWEESTRTAGIDFEDKSIRLVLGSREMSVNGSITELDIAAQSVGGRILVPLRGLSEAMGKEVFYDRGLIAISDTKNLFNPSLEKDKIDGLIGSLNSLPVLGSADKLREIMDNAYDHRTGYGSQIFEKAVGGIARDTAAAAESGTGSAAPAAAPAASQNQASGAGKGDYSTTNVQVQGVDEADIVKTDGEYIYQVNRQRVIVAKAYPPNKMEVASVLDFSDGRFSPMEMYLHGNKLVVIGQYHHQKQMMKAVIFDITDRSKITKSREIEIEGSYISSRKIGKALYLVSNRYVDYYTIQDNPAGAVPEYRDSLEGENTKQIGFDEIRYFPDMMETSYMVVAGIDLDGDDKPVNIQTYLGSGSNIYVSGENLYVATPKAFYASPAIGIMPRILPMPVYEMNTSIYKFSLNEGLITYITKGQVPGNILNQFSMDENKGHFRIATTEDGVRSGDGSLTSSNSLYVLDEMLNVTGKVEDIAPGERIYSVRFMGDRAYMVTFKTVDPLFVIDLKDPYSPAILGALKIPGYSNYLHPYDENHIIGFGKDTVEVSQKDFEGRTIGTNAFYLGMKIALFDVTDVENPVEKFSEKIGDRGTDSPLLFNHKALLFDREKGLLAFPISVAQVKGPAYDMHGFPQYGQTVFQGAYVYDLDPDKGFSLRGSITHMSKEDYDKSGYGIYSGDKTVERIIFIGENLYTLSNSIIKANDINTIEETGKLQIPQ